MPIIETIAALAPVIGSAISGIFGKNAQRRQEKYNTPRNQLHLYRQAGLPLSAYLQNPTAGNTSQAPTPDFGDAAAKGLAAYNQTSATKRENKLADLNLKLMEKELDLKTAETNYWLRRSQDSGTGSNLEKNLELGLGLRESRRLLMSTDITNNQFWNELNKNLESRGIISGQKIADLNYKLLTNKSLGLEYARNQIKYKDEKAISDSGLNYAQKVAEVTSIKLKNATERINQNILRNQQKLSDIAVDIEQTLHQEGVQVNQRRLALLQEYLDYTFQDKQISQWVRNQVGVNVLNDFLESGKMDEKTLRMMSYSFLRDFTINTVLDFIPGRKFRTNSTINSKSENTSTITTKKR